MSRVRNVGIEDYMKFIFIVVLVVVLTVVLRNIYLNKVNDKNNTSIVYNTLKYAIGSEEIYSYLLENDTVILYLSSRDLDNDVFESGVAKILDEKELLDDVIYLDITSVSDKNKYLNDFYTKYSTEGVTSYPAFIAFRNGKIVDVLFSDMKRQNIIDFLDRNVVE